MVELRLSIVFGSSRTELSAAAPPLNKASLWSLATLDSIEKSNFLPFRRDGKLIATPHTQIDLHGRTTDEK